MKSAWQAGMLGIGFLVCSGSARAVTQVFFTSQESVEKDLARLIDESASSIDMALFRFTSRPLAEAISRARARGAIIRIVLDGHKEAALGVPDLRSSFTLGEVRRVDGKLGGTMGIMHHKFVLFDGKRVVTGSFNWTAGAEHSNYENALLTDDGDIVSAYGREFERIWARAELMPAPILGGESPGQDRPTLTRKSRSPFMRRRQKSRPLKQPSMPRAKKKRHPQKQKRV